ncbi:MAG: hypothetical protein Q8S02_13030 [Hydrogenophaga sp.]|nr:hypothetical protein [Hydrogenophaga sp.]
MKFNFCIIQPPGYIHVRAFDEVVQALAFSLVELGHQVAVQVNRLDNSARNVLLGAHLGHQDAQPPLPADTVILNTEQLLTDEAGWNHLVLEWSRRHAVWDYSERNIEFLREQGARRVAHLRLGFQPQLARIPAAAHEDIDVLFYGSVGPRRAKVIDALKARGLRVAVVFGVYGAERDALIARSRLVLNLHHYESKILEVVRIFYLMTNAKAVVCEVGPGTAADPMYLDGVCAVPYEHLVDTCVDLLRDDSKRNALAARARATLARWPQVEFTRALLEQSEKTSLSDSLEVDGA